MDAVTYPDPRVRAELRGWETARVDVSKRPDLAYRFGVLAVPMVVALAGDGRVLGRKAGFVEPESFVAWLRSFAKNRP
jgi:thioredoxin-like negative regulator of GroEL